MGEIIVAGLMILGGLFVLIDCVWIVLLCRMLINKTNRQYVFVVEPAWHDGKTFYTVEIFGLLFGKWRIKYKLSTLICTDKEHAVLFAEDEMPSLVGKKPYTLIKEYAE